MALAAFSLTHTHTLTVTHIMAVCYHQMTKTGITDLITTEVRELRLKIWSLNWMEDLVSLGPLCVCAVFPFAEL